MCLDEAKGTDKIMNGYLVSEKEADCVGCGACVQICSHHAICMTENRYGFIYPQIDQKKCVQCGLCHNVCPMEHEIIKNPMNRLSFGGYIKDEKIRRNSTSGGAFTAICKAFCDTDYVIYGAASEGINVMHKEISDIDHIDIFYSSKYAQSFIGNSYAKAKADIQNGKKVLFSGTPCQIAGLYRYLKNVDQGKLLTVEVICGGIPSALFVKKYNEWCISKYGTAIKTFNYRYTGKNRWDDQIIYVELENGKTFITTRWFSRFYSIFLQRLMSRPSCNACRFTSNERIADITIADLWGVDREYPELYDNGEGCSWIICNSEKGIQVFENAKKYMTGHEVDFEAMRRYQSIGLIRKIVHSRYKEFMEDLLVMDYPQLCKKWYKKPTLRLLYQKRIWNNRRRVLLWKIKSKYNYIRHVLNNEGRKKVEN